MHEANVLIYIVSLMASITLGVQSFKRRFLPVARPLIGFSCLWFFISILRSIELLNLNISQWFSQFLLDFNFFLITFMFPLWFWMMLEFHLEKKVKPTDKRLLIFYIHPLVLYILIGLDIWSNGFLNQSSSSVLIPTIDRIGSYAIFREIYGWSLFLFLIVVTPYIMIRKHQNSIWNAVQTVVYMFLPFIFFILSDYGFLELRLAMPAFIIYQFWISSQYRLLDAMPVALKSMVNKVDSGILVSNRQSKLLYANDYATSLLGLRLSSVDLQQYKLSVPAIIKQHFDFSKLEKQTAQITLSSPETRYIDTVLRPIYHPKTKKHLGATISLHDVTERQETEQALYNLDRQKAKFFAGISHEFRTPLTLSLGNLNDLLDNIEHVDIKEIKSTLSEVKSNNNRLLNLVNQLLELSQMDSGTLAIQPVPINLETYLPSLIANFESLANRQNIRLHFQFDNQVTDLTVYFDETSLDKIISNLMSNALKSITDESGDVFIDLKTINEQSVELSIRDTGCGIPENALPKVFEMFYSHQSNNTLWPQGTGVGLSLVKQLVDQHRASIGVSSKEGQGTTFTLQLRKGYQHFPEDVLIQHDATASYHTNPHHTLIDELSRDLQISSIDNTNSLRKLPYAISEKRVLLVEDNTEMRRYIRKHLAKHFQLIEAANGEEAWELALQTTPDLVLSDVMMPKMNGYELCQQLKNNLQTSHIPVLLLTAKSSQTDKLEGLGLGADDYLSKPFDVKELMLRMMNLITARQTIQAFYQSHGLQQVIQSAEIPKRETTFLDRLQRYVLENISNPDIKVADLAKVVHMSERNLSRKLKALTGETPKQMLLVIRLEQAKQLLSQSDEAITEISYQVGFADSSHFARSFKAHYSMTPTTYRKKPKPFCYS